jgi:hypothetical protein
MKKILISILFLLFLIAPQYALANDSSSCPTPAGIGKCPDAIPDFYYNSTYLDGACQTRVTCGSTNNFNCATGACSTPSGPGPIYACSGTNAASSDVNLLTNNCCLNGQVPTWNSDGYWECKSGNVWLPAFTTPDIYYSTGKVGIGTSNPRATLDIKGNTTVPALNVQSNITSNIDQVIINGSTNGAGDVVNIYNDHGGTGRALYVEGNTDLEGNTTLNGNTTVGGNTALIGNVGIGTYSSDKELDVAGRIRLRSGSGVSGVTDHTAGMWLSDNAINDRAFIGLIDDSAAPELGFYNNGNWRMSIDSAGRVGIGTTTPDSNSALDVKGNIKASGIISANGMYLTSGMNTNGVVTADGNIRANGGFTTAGNILAGGTIKTSGIISTTDGGAFGGDVALSGGELSLDSGGLALNGLMLSSNNWASGQNDKGYGWGHIVNDHGSYKALMIAGNNSGGGSRKVNIYDDLNVNGGIHVGSNFSVNSAGEIHATNNAPDNVAWTGEWVSEEQPLGTVCPNGKFVVGIKCRGSNCDDVQLLCANL